MAITNLIRFSDFRGDIFGSVTVAVVSLPLALSFGGASGVETLGGLYGTILEWLFCRPVWRYPIVSL